MSLYKSCFKRLFDFGIACLGLIIISPLFLLLCFLVKFKLGSPIFFKQLRLGKDEKPFMMLKFRTMTNATDAQGNLLPDTDRFTRFGNFLRQTSLDELPELLNVLKGEMSIVGPRPLYVKYLPYYTKSESIRHTVRGGITGLAQINGRALCKWEDRFAYDIKYVKEMSFRADIKIIWQTFFKVIGKEDIGIPSVEDEQELNLCRDVQQADKIDHVNRIMSDSI